MDGWPASLQSYCSQLETQVAKIQALGTYTLAVAALARELREAMTSPPPGCEIGLEGDPK